MRNIRVWQRDRVKTQSYNSPVLCNSHTFGTILLRTAWCLFKNGTNTAGHSSILARKIAIVEIGSTDICLICLVYFHLSRTLKILCTCVYMLFFWQRTGGPRKINKQLLTTAYRISQTLIWNEDGIVLHEAVFWPVSYPHWTINKLEILCTCVYMIVLLAAHREPKKGK
jgi:hypothetical protein